MKRSGFAALMSLKKKARRAAEIGSRTEAAELQMLDVAGSKREVTDVANVAGSKREVADVADVAGSKREVAQRCCIEVGRSSGFLDENGFFKGMASVVDVGEEPSAELEEGVVAASNKKPLRSRWRSWIRWHNLKMATPVLPLSRNKLLSVAAVAKEKGISSFAQYVAAAKCQHLFADYEWSAQLSLACKDATNKAIRGVMKRGQSFGMRPIDFLSAKRQRHLKRHSRIHEPLLSLAIGSATLMRPKEFVKFKNKDVTFVDNAVTLKWKDATKSEQHSSVEREFRCTCDGRDMGFCVPCKAWALFMSKTDHDDDAPLFASVQGEELEVGDLQKTFNLVDMEWPKDRRFTPHSMRIGGIWWWAMFKSVETVQHLARHKSDVTLAYLNRCPYPLYGQQ